MQRFFDTHRGHLMQICVDKQDGKERILTGILCVSGKGVPMISEGDVDNPELKQVNVNKIKWIMVSGIKHHPKSEKTEDIKDEKLLIGKP